jgi:hypothetical protein
MCNIRHGIFHRHVCYQPALSSQIIGVHIITLIINLFKYYVVVKYTPSLLKVRAIGCPIASAKKTAILACVKSQKSANLRVIYSAAEVWNLALHHPVIFQFCKFKFVPTCHQLSRYSDWLRAGRSGYRIPVGAKFFAHVQNIPGSHPAPCIMGTGPFPGVKRPGRGADHPPTPSTGSRMSGATPLLPLWAFVACYRANFTCHRFKRKCLSKIN